MTKRARVRGERGETLVELLVTVVIMGSAMVEYDFGLPPSPTTNVPPTGPDNSDPHDKLRVLQSAQAQSDKFFREGIVTDFCGGACKGQ